ncbi:MAG TPA: hypothetical protein VNG13_14965 [Mycobacteriales bacterium]|nr:hypothetical protein [Mycobacteriales bacterium]
MDRVERGHGPSRPGGTGLVLPEQLAPRPAALQLIAACVPEGRIERAHRRCFPSLPRRVGAESALDLRLSPTLSGASRRRGAGRAA